MTLTDAISSVIDVETVSTSSTSRRSSKRRIQDSDDDDDFEGKRLMKCTDQYVPMCTRVIEYNGDICRCDASNIVSVWWCLQS